MKKYISIILALVMICTVFLSFAGCAPKTEAEKMREVTAIESANFKIDGSLMTYILVSAAMNISKDITQEELDERGFNADLKFNEQYYEGDTTWFDYFLDGAIVDAENMLVYCEYAHSKGIELSNNDLAAIESEITNMRIDIALNYGLEITDYLNTIYCGYVELEDMRRLYQMNRLATLGSQAMNADANAAVTEDAIISHCASVPESERDQTLTRKLCSILTNSDKYQTEDSLSPLMDELNTALAAASDEQAQIQVFHDFATKYDVSGLYLYENVASGDMLNALDKWIYADGRKIGDVGIVESDYGYHIMYYVADDEPVWMANARIELSEKAYSEIFESTRTSANITVDNDACHLIDY